MITNTIKKLPSGTIYNTSDFTSGSSSSLSAAAAASASNIDGTQYIHKTGDVMTGDLIMEGTSRIIFPNGST
jgi:hypothetical protein